MREESESIGRQVRELTNADSLDRRLIRDIDQSLVQEQQPSLDELRNVYAEAGLLLPDRVVQRFEEVRRFHDSVVANRRSYLAGERADAERRMARRQEAVERLDRRRRELLATLSEGGALEQFSSLQSEAGRLSGEVEVLRQRFDAAQSFDERKAQLAVRRSQLALRLHRDFVEESDRLSHTIEAFQEVSKAISENTGSLTIDSSENGPRFEILVHGAKSKGIGQVQIFCFDMMLMRLLSERSIGPRFLVHDSHLFDPVDERQVGRALRVGLEYAQTRGFQYIVTMNSDAVPREGLEDLRVDAYTVPVRLTDATEDGGLFGLRFA